MAHALTTRRRATAAALALILATGLAVVATHGAGAAGGSVSLAGPKVNKMGTDFNYKVSGTATAAGSYLISFEQFHKLSGCSTTFAGEVARDYFASSTYSITEWGSDAVSGAYSETLAFGADNAGTHGVCSYLVSSTTGATEAHAQAWWTNG